MDRRERATTTLANRTDRPDLPSAYALGLCPLEPPLQLAPEGEAERTPAVESFLQTSAAAGLEMNGGMPSPQIFNAETRND